MKILNTLPELCNYLKFCPVCQEYSRPITYSVSSYLFTFENQKIDGNKLELTVKVGTSSLMRFIFDFSKPEVNSYEYECPDDTRHALYMYASACCMLCKSNTESKFILDSLIRHVSIIDVMSDQYHLMADSNGFNVSVNHSNPSFLAVSRYTQEEGKALDVNKLIYIPMIPLDFSDIPALIKKINILIAIS